MDFQINIKRSKVIWRQVADQIRKKIRSGQFPPGTKLPATALFAQQIGSDVQTVHRALTDLVSEGLITRSPKVGTYVADRELGLSRLGIYRALNIDQTSGGIFYRALEAELQRAADQSKISVQVWTDPRPLAKQLTPWPSLAVAARERTIQGLIATNNDQQHKKWYNALAIPVAALGGDVSSAVDFDMEDFFQVALEALKKQGCRSIAFIGTAGLSSRFLAHFAPYERRGLTTRGQWIYERPEDGVTLDRENPSFGFDGLRKIWAQKLKPDGLIVYPDLIASGVIMGLLAAQVHVPRNLKVALHKNVEIDLFCPFPVTFVTCRIREAARGLLAQLDGILRGREPKRLLVKHTAIAGGRGAPGE